MQIKENFPLAPYTTFYIGGPCRYLIFAQDILEVQQGLNFANERQLPLFVFGGGSNILVADRGFDGVALRIEMVGIDLVSETDSEVTLDVASGEVWDDVVRLACEEGWWGIENLSHIPGFMGALAVQNVGAYGQEASEVVQKVTAIDRESGKIINFDNNQLNFGYRKSIFNTTAKDKYVVLTTQLKLRKNGEPNLSYGDLKNRFKDHRPTIQEIREAVIEIRNKKFPFPSQPTFGNAGSFFRGKILSESEFKDLQKKLRVTLPESASQKLTTMMEKLRVNQGYKTPTAFLIENCVGKELIKGGVSLNSNQPAIIINHSGAGKASEVLALFNQVKQTVYERTGIKLEAEPQFIGFLEKEIAGTKFTD